MTCRNTEIKERWERYTFTVWISMKVNLHPPNLGIELETSDIERRLYRTLPHTNSKHDLNKPLNSKWNKGKLT